MEGPTRPRFASRGGGADFTTISSAMAQAAKRTETLVGLFLFVGLALLAYLIVHYGRIGEKFQKMYTVSAVFTDASGVIKGSHVRLAGAKIGEVVEEPRLTEDGKVILELAIRQNTPPIDKNSLFQIRSISVLGDRAIVISRPEELSHLYLKDGDTVKGGGQSGLEAIGDEVIDLASQASDLMGEAKNTLVRIDSALEEVRVVTSNLGNSVERVNEGLLSEENLTNFKDALAGLKGASVNIREASADLRPVMADARAAFQKIGDASDEAQLVLERASSEIRRIGPALQKVPQAVDSISRVADNASDVLDGIKEGSGVASAMIYEKEPAEDAKAFLKNLRRYGILGYRDDSTFDERDPRNRFRGRRR